jgi:hypothetical protein
MKKGEVIFFSSIFLSILFLTACIETVQPGLAIAKKTTASQPISDAPNGGFCGKENPYQPNQ